MESSELDTTQWHKSPYNSFIAKQTKLRPHLKCLIDPETGQIFHSASSHLDGRWAARVGVIDWQILDSEPRCQQFDITLWHGEDIQPYPHTLESVTHRSYSIDGLRTVLADSTKSKFRLVLADNLSLPVMEILGSTYSLDPEFFASHQLGYIESRRPWVNSLERKPFFTLRWCFSLPSSKISVNGLREYEICSGSAMPSAHWGVSVTQNHGRGPAVDGNGQDMFEVASEVRMSIYLLPGDEGMDCPTAIVLTQNDSQGRRCGDGEVYSVDSELPVDFQVRGLGGTTEVFWSLLLRQRCEPQLGFVRGIIEPAVFRLVQSDIITVLSWMDLCLLKVQDEIPTRSKIIENLAHREWDKALDDMRNLGLFLEQTMQTMCMMESVMGNEKEKLMFYRGLCVGLQTESRCGDQPRHKEMRHLQSLLERHTRMVADVTARLSSGVTRIEIERQLSETSAVKRLSELAFFFIPLSFATSIFGMEVKEFQEGVAIGYWAVAATLVLLGSYFLRWVLQSRGWSKMQSKYVEQARMSRKISVDKPVPLTALVLLPLRQRPAACAIAYLLASQSASIPPIWTSTKLELDAKIAWTFFAETTAVAGLLLVAQVLRYSASSGWAGMNGRIFYVLPAAATLLALLSMLPMIWIVIGISHTARIIWTLTVVVAILAGIISFLIFSHYYCVNWQKYRGKRWHDIGGFKSTMRRTWYPPRRP